MNATADLTSLRELCATEITQAIYAQHGAQLLRFGERGKQVCRQDILHHLDYLQAALQYVDPGIFVRYALWLQDVLTGRNVPLQHLSFSLDLLSSFFRQHLHTPEQIGSIDAVLELARAALASGERLELYEKTRLPALGETDAYRMSVLQGQHRSAMALVLDAMNKGRTLTQVSVQLVQPALYQVGHMWQQSQITVSQEHLATAISQNVLASAYLQAHFAPSVGKTAMFSCVEDNHHSLGIRMLADSFETVGWDVFNLGSNVPMMDMVRQIDSQRPDLLALSMSLPNHIAIARMTIDALRAEMGAVCPTIWVGGLATQSGPQLWHVTKADGWAADALHALEQL